MFKIGDKVVCVDDSPCKCCNETCKAPGQNADRFRKLDEIKALQ